MYQHNDLVYVKAKNGRYMRTEDGSTLIIFFIIRPSKKQGVLPDFRNEILYDVEGPNGIPLYDVPESYISPISEVNVEDE